MGEHTFNEGDRVRVISLKKDGVVHSILGGGKYRVAIGSLTITCAARDLTPTTSPRPAPTKPLTPSHSSNHPRPPQSLDLHGLTVDQAIRKLDSWIDAVVLSDLTHVKVVHGLGRGKIQRAVHERLHAIRSVKRFSINQWNAGETDVYL
jgi:DNA mismatch repair protein MutS2